MILLAANGWDHQETADQLGGHRVTVAAGRNRLAAERLAGIEREQPGRGRRVTKRKHSARTIIEVTRHTTPPAAPHWSVRSLAQDLGIDKSRVARVWHTHELAPHRVRAFKLSNDKHFIEKRVDVVGLYLRPAEQALVLSVDEKSEIQALDRAPPGPPFKRGRCSTLTHDYQRNGATTVLAASETVSGRLTGRCMKRHRHQEWPEFLKLIDAEPPAELELCLIADNYSTDKHPTVKARRMKLPGLHMHFIPTSSSSLTMVERWLHEITTKRIRRGSFRSVGRLERAIHDFVNAHSDDPRPFIWTADPKDNLSTFSRAHEALDKSQNQ